MTSIRNFKIFFYFIFGLHLSESAANSKKGEVVTKTLPNSISYEVLGNCFPKLLDDRLKSKVDLEILKDVADEAYVTSQTLLDRRRITYLDNEGRRMVLTLRNIQAAAGKISSDLSLQSLDSKGVLTDYALTANQKKSPPQDIINEFLLNSSVETDEYSFIDTKLSGFTAKYRRIKKKIYEYELSELKSSKVLQCDDKPALGIICTCSKK